MTEYEYKCVPVPTSIKVKDMRQSHEAIQAYQNAINEGAAGGWEYVGIDEITSIAAPGCMDTFTGKTAGNVSFKMIVYRKPR